MEQKNKPQDAQSALETTNPNIESHLKTKDEGYQIAPEDTMIGYDGNDEQMDMDLGEKDIRRTGKTGTGDND